MIDLYDDARPVRDAAIAEITRLTSLGGADVDPHLRDANVLGVHLTAVMMAFAANRQGRTQGSFQDPHFHGVLAGAIGTLIANIAMGFRPIDGNGQPAQPSLLAISMLDLIAQQTMAQTSLNEQGLQDFIIPIAKNEAGVLAPVPFDVKDMLKGKP